MPQPPSRKDVTGPPPRDVTDLRFPARHHAAYLRGLDPGYLGGQWQTPSPVRGQVSQLVGDDGDEGGEPDSILFINTDQFAIDGPGDKTFLLSYVPIQDGATSLHVRWVPLYVPTDNWTCEDNVLRVTDPGWRDKDLVEVAYAYEYDGEPEPSSEIVPFQSSGWKWLQVTSHDGNDYSPAAFDDSAWATASAPFGQTTPAHNSVGPGGTWPDYVTIWNQGTKMWARRTIAADPGVPVIVSLRWNRIINVYWNGVGVYGNSGASGVATFEIDGSKVLTSNQITFKATDDQWTGPGTGCYFDAEISQALEEA